MTEKTTKKHNVIIENREKALLTGVKETESFTENEVFLFTEQGEMKIKGKNLHIDNFSVSTGDLQITGEILSVSYGETRERTPRNFITKMFR